MFGGSSVESGFEPGALQLQSRNLTTRPPRRIEELTAPSILAGPTINNKLTHLSMKYLSSFHWNHNTTLNHKLRNTTLLRTQNRNCCGVCDGGLSSVWSGFFLSATLRSRGQYVSGRSTLKYACFWPRYPFPAEHRLLLL
ncbi:hypothetical protein AVEN_214610-1 [Araneus ventricosus]|uniref:Uncharacterized protein n=1 Tax=Araneus ventricosus TaxID=182803 RepID=A0A4Y2GMS4_ARAVE|nr:hypothetical protein AVEN_214610-1 [Araneus ventricosus]